MKEQIKNIIENYCEGINHLEFNIADLDKMADEIQSLQLLQAGVSSCCDMSVCMKLPKCSKQCKDCNSVQ